MKKHILFGGGASGMGKASVAHLAELGYEITCACREPENLSAPPGVHSVVFDATDSNPTLQIPETLDGLVYFPGTIMLKPFSRLRDDDFLRDLQINLLGAVRLMRLALPALKRGNKASVVFFSTVAVRVGLPFHASISSAKGAVEGLSRALAAELAPRIRVNCIAPSLTDTPLAASLLNTDEKREAAGKRHPLNRVGNPAEIARLIAFLLGEDSVHMTGQVLRPDGGLSALRSL